MELEENYQVGEFCCRRRGALKLYDFKEEKTRQLAS